MTVDIGAGLLNALMYMGPMAIIGLLVSMYFWERTCRTKIKVIFCRSAGGVDVRYINKEGDSVTINNPKTGWSGTWPVSDLSTIPLAYPDIAGILPRFLQREIQTAIFLEGDLEPLLNRSAHRENVASPNVVNALVQAQSILPDTEDGHEMNKQIQNILDHTATGPTRELVASPDWLGSLRKSTALKALASVGDDLMETLNGIRSQLSRFAGLNSTYVYIGLCLIVVMLAFLLYSNFQGGSADIGELSDKIDSIQKALGIE
jgi:hypothetical protein